MENLITIKPNSKILIVDIAYIGDLLMSTPAYENLRRAFPNARIDCLVAPGSRDVIEHNPNLNSVFSTTLKNKGKNQTQDEAEKICRENYDLAICFHRGHGTLLMLKLAKIPVRIGFTNGGRGALLTHGIHFELSKHRTYNHLQLLKKSLGINLDFSTPTKIYIPDSVRKSLMSKLPESCRNTKLVGINPNAAWATKRWTPHGFANVIDFLSESGFIPVITGSPKEVEISKSVMSLSKSNPIDLTGKTSLLELAALCEKCEFVLSNDSGPMHIAQAAGTKVFSIFGPTDPERCGPWLSEIKPLHSEIDCLKCYRKNCFHLTCMKTILPDDVIREISACITK